MKGTSFSVFVSLVGINGQRPASDPRKSAVRCERRYVLRQLFHSEWCHFLNSSARFGRCKGPLQASNFLTAIGRNVPVLQHVMCILKLPPEAFHWLP
jgi:hypothetical protein